MANQQSQAEKHVQRWVKDVVIDLNFCPFAKHEIDKNTVRFHTSNAVAQQGLLNELIEELIYLVNNEKVSTTLIVYPDVEILKGFNNYLDFLDLATDMLIESGYEGVFQLASFHPDYCFEGESANAPSNYTNRSPYPIIHLLRESSIEDALTNVNDASKIPERNISFANRLGLSELRARLARCSEIE